MKKKTVYPQQFQKSQQAKDQRELFRQIGEQPCTMKEVVQISRGVAEDVVEDVMSQYQQHQNPLMAAISIQVELIKEVLFKAGVVEAEEFKSLYEEKVKQFQEEQKKRIEEMEASEATLTRLRQRNAHAFMQTYLTSMLTLRSTCLPI